MRGTSSAWVAGLVLVVTSELFGAPPDVTSLFPAGGCRGTSIASTIQGKLGDGVCHFWCSRRGIRVTFPEKPGPIQIDIAADAEPGVCWLRFFNAEGASGLRPFVVGTCDEINEVEPNDEFAIAQPLPRLPVVVNGQHGKNGDADSFALSLKRGQVLVASLMAHSVLGSPQDAVLQILGPEGFVWEQNEDDQGFDPQLAFVAPADGLYTLRTWAFPAAPDSSIRLFGNPACVYRLTVTSDAFVDHLSPAAVQAGLRQSVHLRGWNVPEAGIDIEPPVSALQCRFEWPVSGWNHRLPVMALVEPHSTSVEVEPNEAARPQVISIPISITGQIAQARDVDAYQFTGKKGQQIRFEVIAREMGSPLDPVLRLSDSSGKVLKEADDDGKQSADPDFEFTVPADGDYRIAVTDRFLHHGDRYWYVLAMTESRPDFAVTVSADSFVLTPGEGKEIPVTVARLAGFSDQISVGIHGLPSGVVAEVAISEPKGDSAKSVKLLLKTDGQTEFSGPIRVWGRAKTSTDFEHAATHAMKSFGAATSEIWLTVKK